MSYGDPDVMDSLESDLDSMLCSGLSERSEARAMRNIVPECFVLYELRNESVRPRTMEVNVVETWGGAG
jgi:hypothetical protein